jgi:hypothetical protein
VAESADALDSKSSGGNPRAGSSPASGTMIKEVFIKLVETSFFLHGSRGGNLGAGMYLQGISISLIPSR